MASAAVRERLRAALAPTVAAAGYDLEDVTLTPAGRRRLLQVVVDRDGGVDLDAVAELSRALSAALDEAPALGDAPYVLEVSSPGVERPLAAPRHWRRARGRLVRVPLRAGGQLQARVLDADGAGVLLDVDGQPRRLGYAELGRGRVQVEFTRGDG